MCRWGSPNSSGYLSEEKMTVTLWATQASAVIVHPFQIARDTLIVSRLSSVQTRLVVWNQDNLVTTLHKTMSIRARSDAPVHFMRFVAQRRSAWVEAPTPETIC